MAAASAPDKPAGMDKADIKRHLRLARDEPVTVAFGVGRDGKAILQFDRRKQGRMLEKQIKDAAPDSKNHRWGTAIVDPTNTKTVCFTINKAGAGLAKKLIVALKGSGFNKVKIQLDDGSVVEALEEPDEDDPEAAERGGAAAAAPAAAPDPSPAAADPARAPADAATPPQADQANAAALAKEMTGLVKRMLAVIAKDPSRKVALTELATDAQASLKRGDLDQAGAGIDIFREAIDDGEAATATGPGNATANGNAPDNAIVGSGPVPEAPNEPAAPDPQPDLRKEGGEVLAALTHAVKQAVAFAGTTPGLGDMVKTVVPAVQSAIKAGQHDAARSGLATLRDAVAAAQTGAAAGAGAANGTRSVADHAAKHAQTIEKASQVWSATRNKVQAEAGKLEKAFAAALDGHGMADMLTKKLQTKLASALGQLDDGLMDALAALNKSTDAGERAKHVEQANKLVQRYQAHVSSDQTIKMIDKNPFHPLAIEKLVTGSLSALQKHIH